MTLILFLLPLLLYPLRNTQNKYIFWAFSFFMFVLLAFREPTFEGNDSYNYLTLFQYLQSAEIIDIEYGYLLINKFAISNGLGFQWVLIITTAISIIVLSLAALRSEKKSFQVLIFFYLLTYYFYSFNAMRQMTAVSFLILGYTYLSEGRWKMYVLFIYIASLFHATSFIAIIALIFHFKRITISPFMANVALILSLLIGSLNITASFLGLVQHWFERYISEDVSKLSSGESFSVSRFMLCIFFMYMYPRFNKESIYTKLSLLGIVLFNLMSFNVAAMRLAYAFTPVQSLLYASSRSGIGDQNKFDQYLIYGYAFFLYYYMLSANFSGMLDYSFCDGSFFLSESYRNNI